MGVTTLGAIRDVLREHYQKTSQRMSFTEAVKYIRDSGPEEDTFPGSEEDIFSGAAAPEEKIPGKMEHAQFEKHFLERAVSIDELLGERHRIHITETIAIPVERDVYVFQHLPYVDDGLHDHDYFEINYVYRGSCIQIVAEEKRKLSEGEVCIISPHTLHNVLVSEESFIISLQVRKSTFDIIFWNLMTKDDPMGLFFKNTLYEENQSRYLLFHTDSSEAIRFLIQNICRESRVHDPYGNTCCNSYLQILLATLQRRYGETIRYYSDREADKEFFNLALLLEYMNRNYRTVSLKYLAEFFHYSEAYLSRLIRKRLNTSFVRLLQDIRMRHAAELLTGTDMSVADIADAVGYESPDYFTRNFKRYYACTPREFRKKHLQ